MNNHLYGFVSFRHAEMIHKFDDKPMLSLYRKPNGDLAVVTFKSNDQFASKYAWPDKKLVGPITGNPVAFATLDQAVYEGYIYWEKEEIQKGVPK